MKKVILILGFIHCSFGMIVFGQRNNIKFAPLDMLIGLYSLTYEGALSDKTSLLLTTRYTDIARREDSQTGSTTVFLGNKYTQEGFDFELALRGYIGGKRAMEGVYLQPGFIVGDYDITYELKNNIFYGVNNGPDFTENLTVYSLALRTGYQAVLGKYLIMEFGFGMRGNKVFKTSDPLNFPISSRLNGFVPTGSFKLGCILGGN